MLIVLHLRFFLLDAIPIKKPPFETQTMAQGISLQVNKSAAAGFSAKSVWPPDIFANRHIPIKIKTIV